MGATVDGDAQWARLWRVAQVHPELELLHARFRRHSFTRHSHEHYAIGVLQGGEEGLHWRGGHHIAGPGAVVVISPGEVHTGHSTTPEGWSYRMFYPPPGLVDDAVGRPDAEVRFPGPVLHDPALAAALTLAHTALADPSRVLEGHSRLLHALQRLAHRHGRRGPSRPEPAAAPVAVRRAVDYLHQHYADPVTLAELASVSGVSPRHLARGMQTVVGLPPHAYLVQVRVQRARSLLAQGIGPTRVAAAVGFADQSHLNRQFRRVTGVTPGQYARAHRPSHQPSLVPPFDAAVPPLPSPGTRLAAAQRRPGRPDRQPVGHPDQAGRP